MGWHSFRVCKLTVDHVLLLDFNPDLSLGLLDQQNRINIG